MCVGIVVGDARALPVAGGSVQCCVTSPPYWGLRDYGVPGQLGLESTPDEYVANMVAVFREVWRVLRDDGTLWLNLGDSYATGGGKCFNPGGDSRVGTLGFMPRGQTPPNRLPLPNLKPKDLVGIPWTLAFALRDSGWYLRQDIIWCLSGGAWVYAQTQKGEMPMMVRDLARLRAGTVNLWNGQKWTPLLGMSRSKRSGDELEIRLRSGERIGCTRTHRFPTSRGVVAASDLRPGDALEACRLPEPEHPKDCVFDEDAAWLCGLYLAEGSRSGDTIQIAGHAREVVRAERLKHVAAKFGGTAVVSMRGNNQTVRLYGRFLNALIDEYVGGHTAKDKCFAPVVWRRSNAFVGAMLLGYLEGDGHWDAKNRRWRLGFTRNDALARDLRICAARLGATLTLNPGRVKYHDGYRPTYRGEWRFGAWNPRSEIVSITKSRCREVYDLGVEDEPHLFALASGVLTHNSKPNPMPESVRDRCTKAHEYLFLLTKRQKYYYDAEAIREDIKPWNGGRMAAPQMGEFRPTEGARRQTTKQYDKIKGANRRSVWTVNTQPYPEAHFATFPEKLVEPCVLAGTKPGDLVLDPFAGSGTVGAVCRRLARRFVGVELNPKYVDLARARMARVQPGLALEVA